MSKVTVYELADGEIVVWAEPLGATLLKVRQPFGAPVELGEEEALELSGISMYLSRGTSSFTSIS